MTFVTALIYAFICVTEIHIFYSYREQNKLIKEFGVCVIFLATHSGLTRWHTFKGDKKTR
jgi:hypothetical protein